MSVELLLPDVNSDAPNDIATMDELPGAISAPTIPTVDPIELLIRPNLNTLPGRFQFKPVVCQPTFMKLSHHNYYYHILLGCMGELVIFFLFFDRCPLGLFYLGLVFNSFWLISFILIELTRFDRTILKQLICSFEWWWLVGNMIVSQSAFGGQLLERPPFDDFNRLGIYLVYFISANLIGNLYMFSWDAAVLVNRKFKFFWMVLFLSSLIVRSVNAGLYRGPTTPICLHYCTTLEAIYSSSNLTITIFMSKQVIHFIRRPSSFLILTPTLEFAKATHDQPFDRNAVSSN